MTSLTKIYKKSTTYQLNLQGIIPVTGYYETTITGTRFVKGERPAAAPTTKITDEPRLVMWWPKATHKNTVLTLQGILEAKQVAQVQPIRLTGTKASPTKKAPVLTIVAPAVLAMEQNAETNESSSSDDGGEDGDDPDHEDALVRLLAQLEYDLALSLEEELEESECEQEEIADWAEDAEVGNTLIDTSNELTRLEFLRNVLPPTGKYCVVSIQKGKVIQTFPDSIEAIDEWAELQPALGNDSYMALATFDDERRLARCALEYKSVYIDLDCGPNTAYATQDEGLVALRAFVDKVKLPKPTIVSSGSGAHVYFGFTEAADYDQWHGVANALKARIIAENFQVNDAGLPTNSMRILRLPNTINFKNNIETEVKVLIAGTNATVEDYNRILNVGAEISPTVITPKKDFVPNATVAPVVKAPAKVEKVFVADAAKPEVKQLFNELVAPVVSNFTDHPCAIATGVSGIYSVKHQSLLSFINNIKDSTSIKLNWVRTPYKILVEQGLTIRPTDTVYRPTGKEGNKNTYDNLGAFSSIKGDISPEWHVARNEEFTTVEALRALKNSDNAIDVAEYGYQKRDCPE